MHFVMAERGSVFSTQDRAVRLFSELQLAEDARPEDEELVIDFSDVKHVGDSLASAFIGRLFAERHEAGRPAPRLIGMDQEVERAINRALDGGELPRDALCPA
jgi:anti-anti-sigma regulatory factor